MRIAKTGQRHKTDVKITDRANEIIAMIRDWENESFDNEVRLTYPRFQHGGPSIKFYRVVDGRYDIFRDIPVTPGMIQLIPHLEIGGICGRKA